MSHNQDNFERNPKVSRHVEYVSFAEFFTEFRRKMQTASTEIINIFCVIGLLFITFDLYAYFQDSFKCVHFKIAILAFSRARHQHMVV